MHGEIEEQITFRECLLTFSAESLSLKLLCQNIQNLLCLLSHKGTYTLSTTRTFISVYCLLDVLAFVKNHSKGIKNYIMILSIQRYRMIICFSQQPKHATSKKLI
jgi:hypothetical protein